MVRSVHFSLATVDRGLFATDEFSSGFFHWICDVLPRLEAIERSAPNELRSRTLVVPAMAVFPYVPASLAVYDFGGMHLMRKYEHACCTDLLVMPPVAPTGNYRPDLMLAVQERFRRRFLSGGGPDRIFISRSRASRRRIANEEQLLPVLERRGFGSLVAESLSFEEQVRRIGAASVLVGNHGAGLTHMLWMKPGSCVVELRQRGDRLNNCYFSLASALGIRYFYLLCDGTRPRGDAHVTDVVVRPDELDSVLARACAAAGTS